MLCDARQNVSQITFRIDPGLVWLFRSGYRSLRHFLHLDPILRTRATARNARSAVVIDLQVAIILVAHQRFPSSECDQKLYRRYNFTERPPTLVIDELRKLGEVMFPLTLGTPLPSPPPWLA